MTPDQLHELAAISEILDVKPYDKIAAVDRMVNDGRAEIVADRRWRLTDAGERWVAGLGRAE
jgi:Mn-dependent DtxR family transcriptional regulator